MTISPQVRRLSKVAKEFNIGINTVVDFLSKKGFDIGNNPNTKIPPEAYEMLLQEFQSEKKLKEDVLKSGLNIAKRETISLEAEKKARQEEEASPETPEEPAKPESSEDKELFIKDIKSSIVDEKAKADEAESKEKDDDEKKKDDTKKEPKILGKIDLEKVQKTKTKKDKKAEVEKDKEEKEEDKKPVKKEKTAKKETAEEKEKKEEKIDKKAEEKADKEEKKPKVEEKDAEKEKAEEKVDKIEKKEEEVAAEKAEEETTEPKKEDKEVTTEKEDDEDLSLHKTQFQKLEGPTILGKIELPDKEAEKKPVASSSDSGKSKKRKRKRIKKDKGQAEGAKDVKQKDGKSDAAPDKKDKRGGQKEKIKKTRKGKRIAPKPELTEEEISKQIKETLASLSAPGKSKAAKYRRQKRELIQQQKEKEVQQSEEKQKTLQVTEFISASELANMMDVDVNEIISTCMTIGMFVSINQRLDAETISIVAEEFGFEVEFVSVDDQEAI